MKGALITLTKITKVYNSSKFKVYALRGVSLNICRGEFVSIIGPSGSGKTTLMDIIGCLSRPTTGTYLLEGKDVSTLDDDELADVRNRKIGFVFQTFNLLPRLTALQNVELPLMYRSLPARQRRQWSIDALESVDLGERFHHRPSALSGGQAQRVAIARALVTRPSLILADEPTGNLDSKSEADILGLFKELHRRGNTLVVVTHNNAVAGQAERVVTLRDGQIVSDARRC